MIQQLKIEERNRKERSDKKRDVKPTIPISLYETINRLSYVTNTPIKDVGVTICKRGLYSTEVIEYLSSFMKREYWANSSQLFVGDLGNQKFNFPKDIQKRRMTMRFSQKEYDMLARFAYSMDLTISTATGALLYSSIKNSDVVSAFIGNHVKHKLDPVRAKQLKEIYRYMNQNSPYRESESFGAFIIWLMDELKQSTFTLTETLKTWIDERTTK